MKRDPVQQQDKSKPVYEAKQHLQFVMRSLSHKTVPGYIREHLQKTLEFQSCY